MNKYFLYGFDTDIEKAKGIFYSGKSIFIALTYICNAFCQKCITRYHKFKDSSMDESLLDYVMSELIDVEYRGVVNLGSGEPLTYKCLPYFIEELLNKNEHIAFRILTNGMLLNANLPEFFFNKRITWGVTMDGFVNDDLTNLQKGVDLSVVKRNITDICNKYKSAKIYLNYTLNKQNFRSLKDFIDFAHSSNISDIYLTEMKIYHGFRENLKPFMFDHSVNGHKLNELKHYAESLNIKNVVFGINYKKHSTGCFNRNIFHPIIDIDGSTSFCYGHEDKIIGNIYDEKMYLNWYKLLKTLQDNDNNWCVDCCKAMTSDGFFSVSKKLYPYLEQYNGIN